MRGTTVESTVRHTLRMIRNCSARVLETEITNVVKSLVKHTKRNILHAFGVENRTLIFGF